MKKILWFALVLVMSLAFMGCDEGTASMNEDYAGTWYLASSIKYEITDTSYETSLVGVNITKGTINKLTDSTLEWQETHVWDWLSWDEVDEPSEEMSFYLSSDGHTLTLDGILLTDTEPSY